MLTDWVAWDLLFSVEAMNANTCVPDAEGQNLPITEYQAVLCVNETI